MTWLTSRSRRPNRKKNKKDLIDIHIDFLRQKPNYKKFIKYITDDIKSQKSYLYKNYKVYKARDLFTELRGGDISFYQNSSTRFLDTMSNIDGARNTLSEFLCTSLTTICTKDFEFIDNSCQILSEINEGWDRITEALKKSVAASPIPSSPP